MSTLSQEKAMTSPYRLALFRAQTIMGKRKQDLARVYNKTAKTMLIAGAVSATMILIAMALPSGITAKAAGLILALSLLAGSLLILVPFVLTIITLVRLARLTPRFLIPTRPISCPNCSTSHDLFKTTSLYVCPECDTVLHINEQVDSSVQLVALSCQYCGRHHATTTGAAVHCGNCGVDSGSAEQSGQGRDTKCVSCGNVVPIGARFCVRCNAGLTSSPIPITDHIAAHFFKGGLSEWQGLSSRSRDVYDALLSFDSRGTLADAAARIASIKQAAADEDALYEYFSSKLLELSALQLSYCHSDIAIRANALHELRRADDVHSRMLEAVAAKLQDTNSLPMKLIQVLPSSYVPLRTIVLREMRKEDSAANDFCDVTPLVFGKYPKNVARGIISQPGMFRAMADKLRASEKSQVSAQSQH
jgi:hypothetical protein